MGWYAAAMRRLGRTTWYAAVGRRLGPPVDRFLHRATGGRVHVSESFLPVLILTTRGRRSGRLRDQPLAYVVVDGVHHVVGTNWGGPNHPAWTYNLEADPRATIEAKGRRLSVRATRLDDDAFARVWPRFVELWPAYETYLERTDRRPHMFALEPDDPATGEVS